MDFLHDSLHLNIMEELKHDGDGDGDGDEAGVHERLERAFLITDVQCRMEGIQTSGATVAICLVERREVPRSPGSGSRPSGSNMKVRIHAANVGDARAVLSCTPQSFTCTPNTGLIAQSQEGGGESAGHDHDNPQTSPASPRKIASSSPTTNDQSAFRLTHDHKASSPSEIERIENAGGFLLRNRVLGIMAVARSLGDHGMKEFVIGRPFCQTVEVELEGYRMDQAGEFIIVACDGLWDTIEDEEAIQLVRDYVLSNQHEQDGMDLDDDDDVAADRDSWRDGAAKMLCSEALNRGTTDNVTVVVAWL